MDRVFYVIPYTSIIDQNAEEVRKITDRYGIMRAMALSPSESRKLIEQKLEEL